MFARTLGSEGVKFNQPDGAAKSLTAEQFLGKTAATKPNPMDPQSAMGSTDENGQPIDRTVSGFHARVVQHECDHLQGVLYPMRIRDLSRFGFTDVLFPGLE